MTYLVKIIEIIYYNIRTINVLVKTTLPPLKKKTYEVVFLFYFFMYDYFCRSYNMRALKLTYFVFLFDFLNL